MPKKTPGHPLLDEPDNSKELNAQYAKIYRSCIGIHLYISSDYSELLCMLATFVYVFVGMHSELSSLDLQRSPWTPSLYP